MYANIFDTNIIIDYAAGVPQAKKVIRDYKVRVICTLTYMELMTALPDKHIEKMKDFLKDNFEIEPLDQSAVEAAVYFRNHYRMNMPDALIYGFARSRRLSLVTRNIEAFNPHWGHIIVPYKL